MKKIITCTGYHGTGSSIITDLLKEFKNIKSFGEFEVRFLQDPNGVGDLEDRLLSNNSRLNSDRAIYDFKRLIKRLGKKRGLKFWKKNMYEEFFNGKFIEISEKYIEDLVEVSWNGMWHDIYTRKYGYIYELWLYIQIILKKIKLKKEINPIRKKIYYSYPKDDFIDKTKKYINNLIEAVNVKENIIAFDQLIPVCNKDKYLNYFDNIKVIIVDRDPRDLYILNKVYWKEGVVPVDNVEIFIKHFLAIRKFKKYEKDSKKVLEIKFEDFIYKYEITLKKVLEFLELSQNLHVEKQKFFDPRVSINNTQVFELHLEYKEDIQKIEKELKEYCYNFPKMEKRQLKEIF